MTPLHLSCETSAPARRGWPPLVWKVVACAALAMMAAVVLMAWKLSHEPRVIRPRIEVNLCGR